MDIPEMNPLDYVYRSLNCKLRILDENSHEAQYLLKYVHGFSNQRTMSYLPLFKRCLIYIDKVEAIFAVNRSEESERLENCGVANHRLLFHGSSTANLISILSRGLLIAPPSALTTGALFGRVRVKHNYFYFI